MGSKNCHLPIKPEIIIEFYYNGKLSYVEAHRFIVSCCKGKDLEHWSFELVYAYDFLTAFSNTNFSHLS